MCEKRPNGSILEPEGHFLKVFGSYWLLFAPIGSRWLLLAPIGCYWLLLAPVGSHWLLFAPIGSYWLLLAPIGSYGPLCDDLVVFFKKNKRASRSFAKTGFSRFLMDFGSPLGSSLDSF